MNEWDNMTIAGFQRQLAAGNASSLDWWAACRERIDACESSIQAWEYLALEPTVAMPAKDGPLPALFGVPVAIKDIIDTQRMPTTWGTRGYHCVAASDMDAAIVTQLARLGALPMGKTVSTEYAYFQPSKTRNPHDTRLTPGGSSSGSAAAVASGMVPVALGTQTVGSIIRPASYCGVVGFKPTHGTISTSGVKALAPSMDTVGWFSRSVEDSCILFSLLTGAAPVRRLGSLNGIRIAVCPLPSTPPLSPDVKTAIDEAAMRLTAQGASVTPLRLGPVFDELVTHQQVILAYEAAHALASERIRFGESMSRPLQALLEDGRRLSLERYWQSRQAAEHARHEISAHFTERVDAILAPSATGAAPEGLDSTGDPLYSRAWTLLGGPCLNLPMHRTSEGLPVGIQLVADRFKDAHLLAIAGVLMT
ncbi:amidase [Billgrantia endophytica]|uniref:Amidase n=1 Tax=Billgrantia endophytica TaxID=2033802 RepID=A0A2N7U0Q5_9GAMM|nr:amidase [Halomonas endophytica]PMR74018.1 amidase [Halomonas endophytica]